MFIEINLKYFRIRILIFHCIIVISNLATYYSKVCKNGKTDFSSVYGMVYTIVYPHEIRSNCVFLKRNCEWSNTRKTELYVHLKNKKIIKYKLFHLFTGFSLLHFCFLNHSNYIVKLLLANVLEYIKVNA